ncbi:MAG TPA: hypothetical protein VLH56_11820 [Dissulfurispiraceae bacterium]|nr:hypothetical protein [Dissulfurispiraceae bacterium]
MSDNMPEKIFLNSGEATLECAASDDKSGLPRFKMPVAYSGQPMRVNAFFTPAVVDLAGLRIPSQRVPVRLDHDSMRGIGHTTSVKINDGVLSAEGVISRDTPEAREIFSAAKNGFPWQVSVGVGIERVEKIEKGSSVTVNGRTLSGPLNIVREGVLGELSFVDWGADMTTTATVAARNKNNHKEINMPDETKNEKTGGEVVNSHANPSEKMLADEVRVADELIARQREESVAEAERIESIRKLTGSRFPELYKKALTEKWTPTFTELQVLRATRENVSVVSSKEASASLSLEAAVAQACRLPNLEKHYEPQVLDAAHRKWKGNIGLSDLLLDAARGNSGFSGRARDTRELLHAAFPTPSARLEATGSFSNVDIGGILSNIANKFLLAAFTGVEQVWRDVARIRSVRDFKTITSYRLLMGGSYERVGAGGELRHGDLAEEAFTNRADTYGMMLTITRQDIINDDLGAISDVPRQIGREAGVTFNNVFWRTFLANGAFFTGDNLLASSPLSITTLATAETRFANRVDGRGKPVPVTPAILLVPVQLRMTAEQLFRSPELRDTTANRVFLTTNTMAGRFRPAVSSHLGNSAMSGFSATSWYLLAEPSDVAVIEAAFLNGNESPTIETAAADFNVLGIQMRGYHDFGIALQDVRGGLRANA